VRRSFGSAVNTGCFIFGVVSNEQYRLRTWNGASSQVGALTATDSTSFRLQVMVKSTPPPAMCSASKRRHGRDRDVRYDEYHAGDVVLLVGNMISPRRRILSPSGSIRAWLPLARAAPRQALFLSPRARTDSRSIVSISAKIPRRACRPPCSGMSCASAILGLDNPLRRLRYETLKTYPGLVTVAFNSRTRIFYSFTGTVFGSTTSPTGRLSALQPKSRPAYINSLTQCVELFSAILSTPLAIRVSRGKGPRLVFDTAAVRTCLTLFSTRE